MPRITPFEEILSKSELRLIENWAMTKFVPREKLFKVKAMEKEFVRFKLIHTHDGRKVSGLLEYTNKQIAVGFANALNKNFPERLYRVVPVKPTTGRERVLELVS